MLELKIINNEYGMSLGQRNLSRQPLTNEEIETCKKAIKRIHADLSVFVFNDPAHIAGSTCYNIIDDKIYVTKNVLPDLMSNSTHPRDLMSVAAVLAHEYYGHRPYRQEYLDVMEKGHTLSELEICEDECRASITASMSTPNLSDKEKADLVLDAIYRATESGIILEKDNYMKGVLYGYEEIESIKPMGPPTLKFSRPTSSKRILPGRDNNNDVSDVSGNVKDDNDPNR